MVLKEEAHRLPVNSCLQHQSLQVCSEGLQAIAPGHAGRKHLRHKFDLRYRRASSSQYNAVECENCNEHPIRRDSTLQTSTNKSLTHRPAWQFRPSKSTTEQDRECQQRLLTCVCACHWHVLCTDKGNGAPSHCVQCYCTSGTVLLVGISRPLCTMLLYKWRSLVC